MIICKISLDLFNLHKDDGLFVMIFKKLFHTNVV